MALTFLQLFSSRKKLIKLRGATREKNVLEQHPSPLGGLPFKGKMNSMLRHKPSIRPSYVSNSAAAFWRKRANYNFSGGIAELFAEEKIGVGLSP
jgi:hypothetical protein